MLANEPPKPIPTIPELDIWRAATLLIKQHGDNAEVVASLRVDQMAERADDEGRALRVRIKRAVVELQGPPNGLPH